MNEALTKQDFLDYMSTFRREFKQELKDELKRELKQELKQELKDELKAELRPLWQADLQAMENRLTAQGIQLANAILETINERFENIARAARGR